MGEMHADYSKKEGIVETLVFMDFFGGFAPPCGSPRRDIPEKCLSIFPSLKQYPGYH